MEALLDVKGKFAMGKTLIDVQVKFVNNVPTESVDILREYHTMSIDDAVISGGYTFGSAFARDVHNFTIDELDPALAAD